MPGPGHTPSVGKKFQILFALLVFVLAGAGLWIGLGWRQLSQPEPVYQGKPLSYWLKGYDNNSSTNVPTRAETDAALNEMGTNALPVLLRMLATPDSTLKDDFFAWVMKQHFVKIARPRDSQVKHFIALWGIGAMRMSKQRGAGIEQDF